MKTDRQQLLETELLRMRESGPLTASRFVEEVSDEDHPLHDRLEWDDTKAGHEFRLYQARRLIVTVRIVAIEGAEAVPLFIHVPRDGGGEGEYELSRIIINQPDRLAAARDEVLAALAGAQRNLADLGEIVRQYGTQDAPSKRHERTAQRHIDKAREQVALIVK